MKASEPIFFEIDGLVIRGFDGCNSFGGRLNSPSKLKEDLVWIPEGAQLP